MGMGSVSQKTQVVASQEEDLFGGIDGFVGAKAAFVNMPYETLLKEDVQGKLGNKGVHIRGGFRKIDRTLTTV